MTHTANDFEAAMIPAIKAFITANDALIHKNLDEMRKLGVTEAQMEPWTKGFAARDALLKKHGLA